MKCKKILSAVLTLCVVLSVVLIPTALRSSAETQEKVIAASIKFTDGAAGVKKESRVALYSLGFA